MQNETAGPADAANAARAAWLRVLALAQSDALDAACARLFAAAPAPGYRLLRKPESGMAMVRARAGGTGAQFNLGEMSVTRCAVVLDTPDTPDGQPATAGMAYVQGRGQRHAEQAALLDALLQRPDWHQRVQDAVIAPLAQAMANRAARQAATAAQTRVEFFTMARGDD
ncbi:phosphonate C-P lyase system protein PhnG [Cupriavidus sp. SZY C1]|uniref:phosphonate C-P lyase system protein PhnG n=1 Tax=Cupriavidus sp. SZY C1 TaxID=3055037 RepID=UPI0028B52C42|nr:phosphonate C-P lyase system protein PhnG [Cupriavidus sp. SZY C1]MDT6960913.1 phosphonate C-P lyase system protein PhnG [Cupriavidus sp. SZY C1]